MTRRTLSFIPLTAVALMLAGCSNDFGPFSMPSGYAHHNKEYKAPPGSELIAIPETEETMAVVEEPVEEDPVTKMDFTAEPADYFDPAPVSRPVDISAYKAQKDYVPAEDRAGKDSYEDYVAPTYVYDQSYEDRRMLQAADRATRDGDRRIRNTAPVAANYAESAAQDLLDRMSSEFGRPVEPVYLKGGMSGDPADRALGSALREAMADQGYKVAAAPGEGPFVMEYMIDRLSDSQALVTVTLMNGKTKTGEMSGTYPFASSHTEASGDDVSVPSESYQRPIPRDTSISYPPDAISEPVSLFEP